MDNNKLMQFILLLLFQQVSQLHQSYQLKVAFHINSMQHYLTNLTTKLRQILIGKFKMELDPLKLLLMPK